MAKSTPEGTSVSFSDSIAISSVTVTIADRKVPYPVTWIWSSYPILPLCWHGEDSTVRHPYRFQLVQASSCPGRLHDQSWGRLPRELWFPHCKNGAAAVVDWHQTPQRTTWICSSCLWGFGRRFRQILLEASWCLAYAAWGKPLLRGGHARQLSR